MLAGTYGPEMTLGDLVTALTDRAADGDYILLPHGSPMLVLAFPKRSPRPP